MLLPENLAQSVEKEIQRRGYLPIANLTGHGLDQYVLHMDPTIPNIAINGGTVLEEGMAFAIEPFATTGSGRVGEKTRVEIFSQIAEKPVRIPPARAVMERVRDRQGLPFSRRWLNDKKMDFALPGLVDPRSSMATPSLPISRARLSPSMSTP